MPKKEQMLTLKNGQTAPVRRAVVLSASLRGLMEQSPATFQTLLELARVSNTSKLPADSQASQEAIRDIELHAYCDKDGNIDPVVRDVILSAYQVTPEGPVMTQPFRLTNAQEKAIVERTERQIVDWMRRGFPGALGDDDDDHSRSR